MAPRRDPVRKECYEAVTKVMTDAARRYYAQHPERFNDQRGKDALDWSYKGLADILKVLDGYDITRK